MSTKIAMLGSGAFGTAISMLLADNHHKVVMWCHESHVARDIMAKHINERYLPNVHLSSQILATESLKEALDGADIIFQATPVAYLRTLFSQIKDEIPQAGYAKWVMLSKGLEKHTLLLPSQILQDIFGDSVDCVVVAGPNFASEIAQQQFSVTTIAGGDETLNQVIASLLTNSYFKTSISLDPIGVQVGGAIKNVVALAAGIAQGAGYKENARAYLIAQGMHEIALFAEYCGGKRETVYGNSGLGDLILTCGSEQSKNFQAGKKIGRGMTLESLAQSVPVLPEGINTAQSLHEVIMRQHLMLPLCRATYDCIFQGESAQNMLDDIL